MTMREKIARALVDADPTMDGYHESHVAAKLPYADAVLAAMREPTLEQVDAGMVAHRRVIDDSLMLEHSSDTPVHCYRAMIDAAGVEQ